jgi:hypothetical protein
MNDQSICARWRTEAWDCAVLDCLIDPHYFSPATHTKPILTVRAFHSTYPEGRTFERSSLGERWVRVG